MKRDEKIYVAGHGGLAGSAIVRRLQAAGYCNIVTRTHAQLDLTDRPAVAAFFDQERPAYVFLAAAKVGGIHANQSFPADFFYQNIVIQTNVIHESYLHRVRRLCFLGSSCIYPRLAPQPMKEQHLLTGQLESTNQSYAVAKIAGVQMCWAYNQQYGTRFIPMMPTNLYGPEDNFDLMSSHVLPALLRKFHLARLAAEKDWRAIAADERRFGPVPGDLQAALGIGESGSVPPQVILWGTGAPKREFLFSDDMADACLFVMDAPWDALLQKAADSTGPLFNVGSGKDLTIERLAETIAKVVGYDGPLTWDPTMPDGSPQKLLDVSRLKSMGWQASVDMASGLKRTYDWYLSQTD